jgi:DNA-binding IclR family transcriptional regulator
VTADAFAVGRTLQAIELLSFQPASAPQLAGALRIHPRTARRLLNRLVADGWLTRSHGRERTYAPTMRIVALAAQLAEGATLPRLAAPVVARLHAECGLAAHLAVPCYRSVLCLVHRGGGRELPPGLRELMPCHATAAGKALLAHRHAWRASVLAQPLAARTPATLTDPVRLEADLATARARGYAIEDAEHVRGVRGVAAPVPAPEGEAVAAIAITGPAARLRSGELARLGDAVVERAAELTAELELASRA